MVATPHSAEVFIAVDPAQEYEESLQILGVYGSLAAARCAVRRLRAHPVGRYEWDRRRQTEVQEWVGDEHRATWTYDPASGWREV